MITIHYVDRYGVQRKITPFNKVIFKIMIQQYPYSWVAI